MVIVESVYVGHMQSDATGEGKGLQHVLQHLTRDIADLFPAISE